MPRHSASPHRPVPHLAPALACALLLGLMPTAAAQPAGPGPLKELVHDVRDHVRELKLDLRALDVAFLGDLAALRDEVQSGTVSPAGAHDALVALAVQLHVDHADLLGGYGAAVEADASETLEQIILFPDPLVVGDGGLVDDAMRRGRRVLARSTRVLAKAVAKFSHGLEVSTKYDIAADRRGAVLPPITPTGSGAQAASPTMPFRVDLLAGGSDRTVASDGALHIAGSADPSGGETITVTIVRPGDDALTEIASVDPETGRWAVRFPTGGAGELPEGNYAVSARLGDVTLSDSIGVP